MQTKFPIYQTKVFFFFLFTNYFAFILYFFHSIFHILLLFIFLSFFKSFIFFFFLFFYSMYVLTHFHLQFINSFFFFFWLCLCGGEEGGWVFLCFSLVFSCYFYLGKKKKKNFCLVDWKFCLHRLMEAKTNFCLRALM